DIKDWQVEPLLQLLADLHANTWSSQAMPWAPEQWDDDRWQARLDVAGERYPELMSSGLRNRLMQLHEEMPDSIAALMDGPTALIHTDSGHDNTLWRPDGSVVLLDWSNARFGPPAIDLAAHLTDAGPDRVISVYVDALHANGLTDASQEIVAELEHAVRIFVRGMVGFAGQPSEPSQPRLEKFRGRALDVVRTDLDWIDTERR
ncbi:MAG TPA: aminoglycoside phosphotransferase family protein, partial [Acidimicrobiia bacterium]